MAAKEWYAEQNLEFDLQSESYRSILYYEIVSK